MSNAVIGALRVVLGLDTAQFTSGLTAAQKKLRDTGRSLQGLGANFAAVGAGLTATVTAPLIAAGFAASKAATEAADAMGQVEAALASMGNASGRTKDQLAGLADGLMRSSLYDDDDILRKVTANLLTFGRISGENFDRAQQAAVNLATRMKMDLQPATLLVGKALNDPIKGLTAMGRAGIQFTAAQKTAIKAMVESGDVAGAQAIILGELERQFGGAAAAAQRTDPYDRMRDALNSVSESAGGIINRFLVPFFSGVADLLDGFNNLNPAMQQFIVGGAAIAAALGPVLVAVGAVVGAVGTLVATFGAGGALAGAGVALGGLVPLILPVAAAVAAVVGAFLLFRDDIEPVLKRLWDTAQATLGPALGDLFETVKGMVVGLAGAFKAFADGPAGQAFIRFAAWMAEFWGTVLIRSLTAAVRVIDGALKNIGTAFSILGDLLTGDFAGAWEGVKRLFVDSVKSMGRVIEAVFPGALDWMKRLYEGVRDWLQNKLGGVFDWVGRKVGWVGDQFFKLYDAVVGHSYVPDLVLETGQWFAKLQELMVDPTTRATEATADRFRRMRDELRGVLQGLMTDSERATLQLNSDLQSLDQGRRQGWLSQAQFEEQARRARARYAAATTETLSSDRLSPLGPMADGRDISRQAKEAADRIKEQLGAIDAKMQSAADAFSDRFASGLEAALNGDLRGVLEAIFGDMRSQLRDLGRLLFQALQGSGGGKRGGFDIGSAIASMFKSLPKFATGGSILPGGSGGTDSQLVAFWKSPHERVDIGAPGFAQGGAMHVTVGVNDDRFNAYVDRRAAPVAARAGGAAYQGARQTVPDDMAYASRYSRGR